MKKILKAIAIIMCLALPMSAMAMSTIADNELSSVTGQSGVSINLDLMMNVSVATIAWGDLDGATGAATGTLIGGSSANQGWVGLTDLHMNNLRIALRTDLINGALQGNGLWTTYQGNIYVAGVVQVMTAYAAYGGTGNPLTPAGQQQLGLDITAGGAKGAAASAVVNEMNWLLANDTNQTTDEQIIGGILVGAADNAAIAPLTIDVATGGPHGTNVTFVRIGLGSLEIKMDSMTAKAKVANNNTLAYTAPTVHDPVLGLAEPTTTDNTYGSIYIGGLDVLINGKSYVDIYQGSGAQGVVINPNITIDKITIAQLSWGDTDGLPGVTNAGEGWVGLKNTTINTLTIAGPIDIDVATDSSHRSFVNIGLGGVTVGIESMNATVALGPSGNNLNQELGSLNLSTVSATLTGSVQIGAHSGSNGVVLDLNVGVAVTSFTASWGDSDGLVTVAPNPGYVGLRNLAITGMTIVGEVTIDVATVNMPTSPSGITTAVDLMYYGYATHNLTPSFVHIGLGSGNAADPSKQLVVGIDTIGGEVVVANNAALLGPSTGTTNTAGVLGSFYGTGIQAKLNGWVDIAAH